MSGGKIHKRFLKEITDAMEYLFSRNGSTINVKKIRRFNKIKSKDRSRINFYWRWLETLESEGYIEEDEETSPKRFKIMKLVEEKDIESLLNKRLKI